MSRAADEKTLQQLKNRLHFLHLQKESAEARIQERSAEFEMARKTMSERDFMIFQLTHHSGMEARYMLKPCDYEKLIRECEWEIKELEERLSHSEMHNFVSDALHTVGSVEHVRGRVYSYDDKNDGCGKFCLLFILFDVIVVLLIYLFTDLF